MSQRANVELVQHGKVEKHKSEGTQSIGRAIAALREVARAGEEGLRLVDVSEALELKTSTALRLLKALVSEGLVMHDQQSKIYRIGTGFLALTAISYATATPTEQLMPLLHTLSSGLGDTVYLMIRRGGDAFCTAVLEGHNPIRVITLRVGDIRPLGVGSACLAILAFLPAREREAFLEQNETRFAAYNLNRERIETAMKQAYRAGYALNPGLLIPGVYGIGFPVFRGRELIAGIGVMDIKERLEPKRREEIKDYYLKTIATVRGFSAAPA